MRFSTIELLHDINIKGRLFYKKNYIILNGKIFPFFFLQYLKIVLFQQYAIKEWFNLDINQKNFLLNSFSDNLYNYKENQTVNEVNQQSGFIVDIKEKNQLNMIEKIIDNSANQNNYYIFFTYTIYEINMKKDSYYGVDDIINYESRKFFIDFLKQYSTEEYFIVISFFLQYFYKKIEKQAYLEFFFTIFQYVSSIKKNNLSEFIDSYIKDAIHLLPSDSIFNIATYFFQKKISIFFEKWEFIKNNYSIEFWYYFWQEQLWYAQLALLNRINNISDAIFYKKVNRWFLKNGINCYQPDELLEASLRLYNLDYLHKKLQTNADLDLESFFYIWFSVK